MKLEWFYYSQVNYKIIYNILDSFSISGSPSLHVRQDIEMTQIAPPCSQFPAAPLVCELVRIRCD